MTLATTNFIKSIDKLEEMLVKEVANVDTLKTMSAENLAGIQACLQLIDAYKEMLDAEAEKMFQIENKLDKVLFKLKEIES